MPARTPTEAYFQFIEPIQRALNFISVGRLLFGRSRGEALAGQVIDSSFNAGDPSPLTSVDGRRLFLRAGCRCKLHVDSNVRDQYRYQLIAYSYDFLDDERREILAFHWNTDASGNERSYPHLHLGRAVSGKNSFRPGSFHKLHIPTGTINVESLIRFAIAELGVAVRPGLNRLQVLDELSRPAGSE